MTDNARIVREALAHDSLCDVSMRLGECNCRVKHGLSALTALETELATAKADLKRAREAINSALEWFHNPDEHPLTQFERIGDWFYSETGHLRPGKDDRTEDTSSPENRDRFVKWCQDKSRERLAILRAALAPEQKG